VSSVKENTYHVLATKFPLLRARKHHIPGGLQIRCGAQWKAIYYLLNLIETGAGIPWSSSFRQR
jgi:hypothetical protein